MCHELCLVLITNIEELIFRIHCIPRGKSFQFPNYFAVQVLALICKTNIRSLQVVPENSKGPKKYKFWPGIQVRKVCLGHCQLWFSCSFRYCVHYITETSFLGVGEGAYFHDVATTFFCPLTRSDASLQCFLSLFLSIRLVL